MSIRDRRLKAQIDEVIKRNLANGYVPTANEVIGELSQYLIENNLSVPSFQFVKKGKKFTAKDLDTAKQKVRQDLNTLYEALIEIYQLTEEQIEKFTTEKKKYDYRLFNLESQLTSLLHKYSTSGYIAAYRDNFSDIQNIDLSKTTADIDITNHEATLKRLNDASYDDFTISVSAGTSIINQNGNIMNLINRDGAQWQGIIEKTKQEQTSLTIDIDVKDVKDINKIEIGMPMLKKCGVTIYTSQDGDRWLKEYAGETSTRCTANFSTRLRYIRIILSKTEADKLNLGTYMYYFIISEIKLGSINYAMESEIVSRPISVGTNINKVSIVTEEVTPPTTSIEYYVAAYSNNPDWIPISPIGQKNAQHPTVVTFNSVQTNNRLHIALPEGISNDAYELKNLSINGQRLFAIAEIEGVNITNYRLMKGVDAWKVETLNIAATGEQTQAIFVQNKKDIITSYKPILQDKPGLILNSERINQNSVIKFSTAITRETGDTVVKEMIASSHPVTVYLNGSIIYKGTPRGASMITYPFRKGVNVLEVIVNIQNAPASASLDLNLQLYSIGSSICANRDPVEPVSLFNLRYNTNNQYNVYTLYQMGDMYVVIVKDPDLSIRYDFIYDYITEPVDKILFKAVLKRKHTTINATPKLISYELRCT